MIIKSKLQRVIEHEVLLGKQSSGRTLAQMIEDEICNACNEAKEHYEDFMEITIELSDADRKELMR